jgi:hypothetical protein
VTQGVSAPSYTLLSREKSLWWQWHQTSFRVASKCTSLLLFMGYLKVISMLPITKRWLMGWSVSNELQTMCKTDTEVLPQFLLYRVTNLRAWQKVRNFFTKWVNISFSRALLYGASLVVFSSAYALPSSGFCLLASLVSHRAMFPCFDCETNAAICRQDYKVSNGRMITQQWAGKHVVAATF